MDENYIMKFITYTVHANTYRASKPGKVGLTEHVARTGERRIRNILVQKIEGQSHLATSQIGVLGEITLKQILEYGVTM
jgi:hypothetical protein